MLYSIFGVQELEELQLGCCPFIGAAALRAISEHCTSLQALQLPQPKATHFDHTQNFAETVSIGMEPLTEELYCRFIQQHPQIFVEVAAY